MGRGLIMLTMSTKESSSGIVTLQDEPEFADAIDCMVSYFYSAGYTTSEYESSAALLHARVAVIADKYDCPALVEVAKAKLADCIEEVSIDDWVAIADLIYNYAALELEPHAQLRKFVVEAATAHISAAEYFLQNEGVEELLRSNADLATDLLLSSDRDKRRSQSGDIFVCNRCSFAHFGALNCAQVATGPGLKSCPQCAASSGSTSKRVIYNIGFHKRITCSSCNGMQTSLAPESASGW